jgi:hypothetical protein
MSTLSLIHSNILLLLYKHTSVFLPLIGKEWWQKHQHILKYSQANLSVLISMPVKRT